MAHNPLILGSTPRPATKNNKIEMKVFVNIESRIERNEEETSLNDYFMTQS